MDKRKLLKNKIELECGQYCRNILRKRKGTFKDDIEKVENYKKLSRSAMRYCDDVFLSEMDETGNFNGRKRRECH